MSKDHSLIWWLAWKLAFSASLIFLFYFLLLARFLAFFSNWLDQNLIFSKISWPFTSHRVQAAFIKFSTSWYLIVRNFNLELHGFIFLQLFDKWQFNGKRFSTRVVVERTSREHLLVLSNIFEYQLILFGGFQFSGCYAIQTQKCFQTLRIADLTKSLAFN